MSGEEEENAAELKIGSTLRQERRVFIVESSHFLIQIPT
jgi:hypothetical protein